jgi:hypothetical protein
LSPLYKRLPPSILKNAIAEPETAITSTIVSHIEVRDCPRKNYASCGLLEALYDISTTYTKNQQLTGNASRKSEKRQDHFPITKYESVESIF